MTICAGLVASASAQGGKVGSDRVRPPKPPAAQERVVSPRIGTLVVLTGVGGAEVRLEPAVAGRGRRVVKRADASGGAIFEKLAPGRYLVVASAEDHRDTSAGVMIVGGRSQSVVAGPVPLYGTVVLSGPDLASATSVTLDGKALDIDELERETDGRLRLRAEPGEHEIAVEAPGRVRARLGVRVEAGREAPVAVALIHVPGTIRIAAVAGASVWVDDRPSGTVPSSGELAVEVDPAAGHKVRVEADGFLPYSKDVLAGAGEIVRVAANLEHRPTSGPFGELFIDGELAFWDRPKSGWSVGSITRALTVTGTGIGLARGLYYEDVEMRFGLKMFDPAGAAWVLRSSSAGDGYLFMLTGPGARWPNQLRVYALSEGRFDPAAPIYTPQPVIPVVILGESYVVRVRAEGNLVRTWLQSGATGETVSIGSFTDREHRFRAGTIGFAGTGGRFDVFGLEATPIAASEPDANAELKQSRR